MKRFLIFLLSGVLCIGLSYAQIVPPPGPGLKQRVTFTVSEKTFNKLATSIPFSEISPVDMELLQPHTVWKQVERQIETDGDFSASITILNAAECWADWPTRVVRYDISPDGVRLYKTDGSLYSFLPKTADEAQDYAHMKALLASESAPLQAITFPAMPTSGEIAQLQAGGGTFLALNNSSWRVRQGAFQTEFDAGTHTITRSQLDGNSLVRSETTEYAFNNNGVLVPTIETIEVPVVRPSGICMQQVTVRTYSNYVVAQTVRNREKNSQYSASGSAGVQLLPNPAMDAVTLQLKDGIEKGGVLQVCDLSGAPVLETTLEPGEQTHRIELADYPPGLYFVRLRTENSFDVIKLIKQ